jgi:hypothetical protein
MAENKDKEELSLEEAISAVKRLSRPDRPNEELELLKKASSTLLNEVQPGFEFEEDEDGGSSATEELTKPPGFMEQIGAQAAALGPAGIIALASAAYFQVDTVVEETRTVQQVAEEKWEEVKLEHPNINWDDPMAGFTTMLGMGDIEIDLDPPTPQPPTVQDSGEEASIDDETETEADETETAVDETETEAKKEQPVEEEKEEPKKKKKGFFSKLLGGDDEEEAEEESEPEPEAEAEEAKESEEESNEPEPEAEEQVEEKPKKKRSLFSFLTGGDDDKDESDSDEQGEPQQDDAIPDEQTKEESTTESETETSEGEVDGGGQAGNPETNANTAESNGIKKSSGGGLLSLFGINSNEEEVVEQSEISADEEPVVEIAEAKSVSEAPPISEIVKGEAIEVAVEAEPKVNIADIVVDAEIVIDDIEVDARIEIADLSIDDVIEETVVEAEELPIVFTPNDGAIIVSPAGSLYATQF